MLKIKIDDKYKLELEELYKNIELGNISNYNSDCGIDLYMPEDIILEPYETKLVSLGIKAEYINNDINYGYHLYPRSSIYKTKIRLANSVGIIDPEYRGNLKVALDNISNEKQILKKHNRYFQIVFVKMDKIPKLNIVESLSSTIRNENGFGSTG